MTELSGKRVVIVGLGASGVAAAQLCLARGARVVANDARPETEWSDAARALATAGAELIGGGHERAELASADLVVVSPGVPTFAELEAAERGGVPVIGEVELAVRELRSNAPVIAVGGTNGKSTTTALLGALLQGAGLRAFVGGNFGEPLASHVDEAFDAVVLEVSSFQMERVSSFKPKVALLLNVTPDHLDRYETIDAYAAAKGNAFRMQSEHDLAVIPEGCAITAREARRGRGRIVTFGPGGAIDVQDDVVVDSTSGERYVRRDIALTGGHNALNVAAALAAISSFSPFAVSPGTVRRVLAKFRGLAHRTALVAEIEGVRYYDDSKGTNVGAAVTALTGLVEAKAVLIAGGRDKGGSYEPLARALRNKGRAAVLIGEAAKALADAIGDSVPVRRAATIDDAVREARALAQPGDAVLLSPACSSFDMFRDYKHRGDEFVRAVLEQRAEATS
jgi:UDP-N-acetylmuramoylalanine--D-glutamate ligase